MRTVAVVTVDRSDAGIYRPILRRMNAAGLRLRLIAAGYASSSEFGARTRDLARAGIPSEKITISVSSDTPAGAGAAMGAATAGFSRAFARKRPDILLVLGDRFEMFCAALAALPFRIPVAHVHGGEVTHGAMDDALRHALSKMSHLHFVSTAAHGRRLERMGEEPWRITVSGAPGLDNLSEVTPLSGTALERALGLKLMSRPAMVTFHPATLESLPPEKQIAEVLAALESFEGPVLLSRPNADPGGRAVFKAMRAFAAKRRDARVVESLGTAAYFGLMKAAAVMVGNSSSGLIEAPSFGLPVVNVGSRQGGRTRGGNVIDAPCRRKDVAGALRRALSPAFHRKARKAGNPYQPHGSAAKIICDRLRSALLDDRLIMKRFHDGGRR